MKTFAKWCLYSLGVVLFLLAGPLYMMASGAHQTDTNWRSSSRDSAGLAPDPAITSEAIVQVYGARAFRWRGYFAIHTWISTKEAGADYYQVHDVTGFRRASVNSRRDTPDRAWYGSEPQLIAEVRGEQAAAAISNIEAAIARYPFAEQYNAWPGPNSNTFIAWVIREVPELTVALPGNAVGKDYLGNGVVARVPGGTGYQLSLGGYLGVLMGAREGLELNLLGLTLGISPAALGIKLPGIGELALRNPNPL